LRVAATRLEDAGNALAEAIAKINDAASQMTPEQGKQAKFGLSPPSS
jgi:hypothetical protein